MKTIISVAALLFAAQLCLSEETWPVFYYYPSLGQEPQVLSMSDTVDEYEYHYYN